MIPNFFNSSKPRTSAGVNRSTEQESQNSGFVNIAENQAWNPVANQSTDPDDRPFAMDTDETPADSTALGNEQDSVMASSNMFEPECDENPILPVSSDVHEQSSQQAMFEAEHPAPIADPIMCPRMVQALLQSTNAAPADTSDRFLQPSRFMTPEMHGNIQSGDTTMGGMGGPQTMQGNPSGTTSQFDIGNDQVASSLSGLHDMSPANNGMNQPDVVHSFNHGTSDGAQRNGEMSPAAGDQPREDSQMVDSEVGNNVLASNANANEVSITGDLMAPGVASPSSSPAGPAIRDTESAVQESLTRIPPTQTADDFVILADQQRGRLAKYRPSNENWPPRNRNASVPPKCGDHYSYMANWPPQEPPTCDFGRQVDVFPPREAPLHVHMHAYALRWGVWASEIKDKEVRQQVLDAVADKMREAWENTIGDNYYLRPVAPVDDSDNRNETEEKAKRGRKRAVSPSRLPAGFTCEGKDALAVTNRELIEHNLTMDMINKRVQERDFDAGEQILDEVMDSLGRDRLVVKDWSTYGYGGAVHGRNLLMYCLYIVQECRNERRKLNNLMRNFTREIQKKNTRARIENYQEREFQHLALASELEHARREENPESTQVDEEDGDEGDEGDRMETDTVEVVSQAEDSGKNKQDEESAQQSESESDDDDPISPDQEFILHIAQAVLSANSDTALYTAFAEHAIDSTSFDARGGLRTGEDPDLQAGKVILGKILEWVTRLISLKEMIKRQQDPSEVMKMQYDVRLSYERIQQAQVKLGKTLRLDFARPTGPNTTSISGTNQGETSNANSMSSSPQVSEDTTTEIHDQPQSTNVSGNDAEDVQNADFSSSPKPSVVNTLKDLNMPSQQMAHPSPAATGPPAIMSRQLAPTPQNVASIAQTNVTFTGGAQPGVAGFMHSVPQGQYAQVTPPQLPSNSQAIPPAQAEDAEAKRAYIDEKWRPWLDLELTKRGQPASQGVITDWPQLRDIIARLGFTTSDRNQLLRNFKNQFDQWMIKRQLAQQSGTITQSPALSKAIMSPAVQPATLSGVPSGWPSNTEVATSIPPQGIHATHLLQKFQHRVGRYVNQFSQLIQQVAFMDPNYVVYPSKQHAAMARQQSVSHQGPVPNSPRPAPAATPKPHQIVKLKLPQLQSQSLNKPPVPAPNPAHASLPPSQDESSFPPDYLSTLLNTTRGFSFRHLPHATLPQRQAIDDLIADYITKTSKSRKKTYHGTYATFTDPQFSDGLPIAHGFWDFKDGSKAERSDWFYEGSDVPDEWLERLGVGVAGEQDGEDETGDGHGNGEDNEVGQVRNVWDKDQQRFVKFRLAGPVSGQVQAQGHAPPHQDYNTYPPGHKPFSTSRTLTNTQTRASLPLYQSTRQPSQSQTSKSTARGRTRNFTSLDGNDDETQTQGQGQESTQSASVGAGAGTNSGTRAQNRKRGGKRGSSALSGAVRVGRGGNGSAKRRKKNPLGDDDEDGDYIPGDE